MHRDACVHGMHAADLWRFTHAQCCMRVGVHVCTVGVRMCCTWVCVHVCTGRTQSPNLARFSPRSCDVFLLSSPSLGEA